MAGSRVLRSVSCFSAAISATVSDTRGVVLPRCHTAVLHAASSLLYDVPSTVLVSRCDTAIPATDLHPLRRPLHRAGFLVRLPSYGHPPSTTSRPSCSSPGVTLLSYGPPPLSATTSPPPLFPRSAEHASHDTTGKCKL